MKKYLFSFFLLFSFSAFSQTWEELNEQVIELYNKGEYANAIPIAENAVEKAKKTFGDNHPYYGTSLNNLANMYEITGDKKKAEIYYHQSLILRKKILEVDHEDRFYSVQNLANLYISNSRLTEAAGLYAAYLKELVEKKKENTLAYVKTLSLNGDLYWNSDLPELAEKELLKSLELQTQLQLDSNLLYNTCKTLVIIYKNEINLIKAEPILKKYTTLSYFIDGPQSEIYTMALYQLAALYVRTEQYAKAEPILCDVVKNYAILYGTESNDYSAAAINLSKIFVKQKEYASADSLVTKLIETQNKKHGSSSPEYENITYNSGIALLMEGSNKKGEQLLQKSIDITRKFADPAKLVRRLYTLDSVYNYQHENEKRELLLLEILALQKKYHVLSDSAHCLRIADLAGLYTTQNKNGKALAILELLDSTAIKGFKKTGELYLLSRVAIGNIYTKMRQMNKAERFYLEALKMAPISWSNNSDNYANFLTAMGVFYEETGQPEKSIHHMLEAVSIYEKIKNSDYTRLVNLYMAIAGKYNWQNNDSLTEQFFLKAISLAYRELKSKESYIYSSNQLAGFYFKKGKYEKGDSIYNGIKNITNIPQSILYESYITTLIQQGYNSELYVNKKLGATYIEEALAAANNYYKSDSMWSEDLETYLSEYYLNTNQYEKAIKISIRSFAKRKEILGENNPAYAFELLLLARMYLVSQQYDSAEKIISHMNKIEAESMLSDFEGMSDAEKENYIQNKVYVMHLANTLLFRNPFQSPLLLKQNFEQLLLQKSMILSQSNLLTKAILESRDTVLLNLYERWQANKQILSKELSKPVAQQRPDIDKIKTLAENQQKEIARKSTDSQQRLTLKSVTIKDIQSKLSENEVVIEFVSFAVFSNTPDSNMYAAYIIKKNDPVPVFVPLCEKRQLQKLFDTAGASTTMVKNFYRGIELGNSNSSFLGIELYKLIWEPLEPYLKGIKKVSYSPAGKLYSIAFHALPVDSNTLLIDKYNLQQYTSTRQVALRADENQTTKPSDIALFGDAEFSMDSLTLVKQRTIASATDVTSTSIYIPENRGSRGGAWNNLPGTAEEVKKIKALFDENKIATKSFIQTTAS
ncbi:MAG: tetratricopeptide repeat protein, partial [Chitinophagaceae bacterium]